MIALQGSLSSCLGQSFYDYGDLAIDEYHKLLLDAVTQWDSYAFDETLGIRDKNFSYIFRSVRDCVKIRLFDLDGRVDTAKEMAGKIYYADVGSSLAYMMTMREELECYVENSEETLLFNVHDFNIALDSMICAINNYVTGADLMLAVSGFRRYQKTLVSNKDMYFHKLVENMSNKVFKYESGSVWSINWVENNE